jgi:phage terminase small subunit
MARAVAREFDAEPTEYGPAMAALGSDKMRSFVMFFVICGSGAEAARRAGYSPAGATAETYAKHAWQLCQKDSIRAAIMEETRRWFHVAAPAAVKVYHDVLTNPEAKDQDRLRAADAVMARVDPVMTGQVIQVEHQHHHRHTLSANEIIARIAALAGQVGAEPRLPVPVTIEGVAE